MPITAACFILVFLFMALAVDAGFFFMKKRDLQRAADSAALAGAQTLPGCTNSFATVASANLAATVPASEYTSYGLAITSNCGTFTAPAAASTVPGTFVANNSSTTGNAVQVTLTEAVPSFFGLVGNRSLTTTAIARKASPVAEFSVDSGILALSTSNSILGPLLSAVGVSNLTAYVGYGQQLAGVTITPSGLLQALGVPVSADVSVASLNSVAAIQNLTLGQLLSATNTALASQNGALSTSVTALSGLVNLFASSSALNIPINLFGSSTTSGIIANIDASGVNTASALTANVSVMDLITAAVAAANGTNALSIPSISVLGNTITVSGSLIGKPQIAIGGVGATATSAQVRLYLTVNTTQSVLGGVLNVLNTSVTLPMVIEVAQSTGTLTALSCGSSPSATVQVTSGLVNMCVGAFPSNIATSTASCTTLMSGRTQIAQLVGIPIYSGVNMSLVTSSTPPPSLTFTGTLPQTKTTSSSISLSQLLSALLTAILGDISTYPGTTAPSENATTLATQLIKATSSGTPITAVQSYLNTAASSVQSLTSGLASTLGSVLTLNVGGAVVGLASTVNSLVSLVGNLLGTVLSVVNDILCLGSQSCQISSVASSLSSGNNLASALASVLYTVLSPTLNALSTVLNSLLQALGIQIGITSVKMMSINCQAGLVQLVY